MSRTTRLSLALVPVLAACSSGGGGSTAPTDFALESVNVQEGALWPINREILLTFSQPIDLASVTPNTVRIRTSGGRPGIGTFQVRGERTLAWQPACPTRDDLSDAGLEVGTVTYLLEIPGREAASNVVRARSGQPLARSLRRHFVTPGRLPGTTLFLDPRPGAGPAPVVRAAGSSEREASFLRIGGSDEARVWFEREADGTPTLSDPAFRLPLNLYSDPATRVAFVLVFDQPIDPSGANVSSDRLWLEFETGPGAWRRLDTRLTLEANCTETGARVRLEPVGVLPVSTSVRAVVRSDLADLVGQVSGRSQDAFALAATRTVDLDFLDPPDLAADAFEESFDFGGEGPLSFEDAGVVFDVPLAHWGDGRLEAAFDFDGDGGPGGDFDWVISTGFAFDTTRAEIVGGPDGLPTTTQIARGGVVHVRDLDLREGAVLQVQGPNPMRIVATGTVRIDGRIDVSGFAARKVISLNTGTQREPGGLGIAGGGRGGFGNPINDASSPRGGTGDGPFGLVGAGGLGGVTGFTSRGGDDGRRPGGGGGGRFARDLGEQTTPDGRSLEAGAGYPGNPQAKDALSFASPPRGGDAGQGPFLDGHSDNDFFGIAPVIENGALVGLLRGELTSIWAGYGGGGGGNASSFDDFPQRNWNQAADEKGGGGGGGGGALRIQALGPIAFGANGRIVADGGAGATGESTLGENHVGGTGGGGSGGHVILESATRIDFTDEGRNQGLPLRDALSACGPTRNRGAPLTPPNGGYSNGGEGGAGVLQIHVPEPLRGPGTGPDARIRIPAAAADAGDPLDLLASPEPYRLLPTFAARSRARSRWISIGGADHAPEGPRPVRFLFDGIATSGPDAGKVLRTGERVRALDPILSIALAEASILPDGNTVELRGAPLVALAGGSRDGISNDLYLRDPRLLEDALVRLAVEGNPLAAQDLVVTSARLLPGESGPGDESLRLTTAPAGALSLAGHVDRLGSLGPLRLDVVPRFFGLSTTGVDGALPLTADIRIRFQAARDNGVGLPDESRPLVDWTSDIGRFNATAPGDLRYFRFEVDFDLDARATGVGTDVVPVDLDFLRVPFVF